MNTGKSDLRLWLLFTFFAVAGFCFRLYLDRTFERLVPEKGGGVEMGFLDSFMIEASRDVTAEEGTNE